MQSTSDTSELFSLIHGYYAAMRSGELTQEQHSEFEALICNNPIACEHYIWYMAVTSDLHAFSEEAILESDEDIRIAKAFSLAAISQEDLLPTAIVETKELSSPPNTTNPSLLTTILHTPLTGLSTGWPVAYLIAMVVFGVGALIGTFTHVSQPTQTARCFSSNMGSTFPSEISKRFVGRITSMVGCKWGESAVAPASRYVTMDQEFHLTSGLMEITYDTGARVILQSPVRYTVDSENGGFLAIGKLTGKVEVARAMGFVVRTRTATVTDLGTEFGIEVDRQGATFVQVYRGDVKMELNTPDVDGKIQLLRLGANESACTDRLNDSQSVFVLRRIAPRSDTAFKRQLSEVPPFIDLLDIVAGGDGTGYCRENGLDPLTGMEDPSFKTEEHPCTGTYCGVSANEFIDGVFTIAQREAPIQLDSAGHLFDGFPKTDGQTYGSIWARAAVVRHQDRILWKNSSVGYAYWIYSIHPGLDAEFMPKKRGLLGLHPNAGITFDLSAIRQAHQGRQLVRFHSTVGKDYHSLAEIWVFIDGRLEVRHSLKPTQTSWSGVFPINVAIKPTDRFLTLASTDGGDGSKMDWVVFGDAELLCSPTEGGKDESL